MNQVSRLHNLPPEAIDGIADLDPNHLVDPSTIRPLLDLNYPSLGERSAELTAGVNRWLVSHGAETDISVAAIADDGDAAKTTSFLSQLMGFAAGKGEVEEVRKRTRDPLVAAGKEVDAWRSALTDQILAGASAMRAALERHVLAKRKREEEARRIAAEEARRAAEEAAERASVFSDDEALAAALRAEEDAEAARRAAETPVVTSIRGTLGGHVSLGSKWCFEVTDIRALCRAVADGIVPSEAISTNDPFLRSLIRGKSGVRDIPGLRIFEDVRLQRRAG